MGRWVCADVAFLPARCVLSPPFLFETFINFIVLFRELAWVSLAFPFCPCLPHACSFWVTVGQLPGSRAPAYSLRAEWAVGSGT